MHRGYVKLWRKLRDNPLWLAEPFTKGQAWVDLLMLANHERKSVSVRGIIVIVESGQVLAGEQFLADRWKWSRGKVRRLLRQLEQKTVQQIVQQKNNVCTVISITNWSEYQANGTADGTTSSTTERQQKDNRKTTDGHTEELQELITLQEEEKPPVVPLTEKTPKLIIDLPYQSEQFRAAWDGYMESRKLNKMKTTGRAKTLLIGKIKKLAANESQAIELLDNATIGEWKSIYAKTPSKFDKPDPEAERARQKAREEKDMAKADKYFKEAGISDCVKRL